MPVWTGFLLAFSALLPLINPLGSALVFLALVGDAPPAVYHSLARRIAINNVVFLASIELAGSLILNFFGISLPTVQVAGGIVVAVMGWNVLNENDSGASARRKQEECDQQSQVAEVDLKLKTFYPFTFPVTSGPGTLVATLALSAHVSGHTLSANILGHCGVFLAVIVLSIVVYFCYAYAPRITTRISSNTVHGIMRVTAFILLCIGVQIAWNGLSALLRTMLKA
jgi:multiple antibiotic resistance protein